MDFDPGPDAQDAERRVSALLEEEAADIEALASLERTALRRLALQVQAALAGDGDGVGARLAVARVSPPLLLAAEATRHLQGLLSLGALDLPAHEAGALARGELVGAVARADASGEAPASLERRGGGWRLRARKSFVTNGPLADWIAVFAGAASGEAICLLSPRDPGVRLGPCIEFMGLGGLAVSALVADDAPVPEGRVLGPFDVGVASGRYERDANLSIAIAAAGLMRGALRAANRGARARERGGRPLFARQEVAFRLAEVLALTEAAELLCHRAAWLVATAAPEAATVVRCAKVFCTESAERTASACLQVLGGEGYRRGGVAERAYRDAKGLALAGTTLEVARMEIADALLSRP